MLTARNLIATWWLVTAACFAAAIGMLVWYTPVEATMGPIQKIFYLHLPVAIGTFLACAVCFVASIGYLLKREAWWDDLAAAGARVAVMLCTIVLMTGMIWGKSAWGHWWTWSSPRLTFSLLLWLLFVVYLVVRMSVEPGQRRAVISAVYGIIAFLDVPLVYLSTRLIPEIHPTGVQLAHEMRLTLAVWFVPVILLAAGLVRAQFGLHQRQRLMREAARPSRPAPRPFRLATGGAA